MNRWRSALSVVEALPARIARAGLDLFRDLLGPRPRLTASVFVLAVLASVAAGVFIQTKQLPKATVDGVNGMIEAAFASKEDSETFDWEKVNTSRHTLSIAKTRISDVTANGGSLAEVGDNILLATPQGQFSYLDSQYRLHALDLRVRMNLETLRNTALYRETRFDPAGVRTHDLLVIPSDANNVDLYVSFNRFVGDCFEFVVTHTRLHVEGSDIRPVGGWNDIWTASPCIPLKKRGSLFEGLAGGGRMIPLDNDTILVSVGDFQFDGFYEDRQLSADPATDLGKIIALNIRTGASRHYVTGLRNPQGLMFDNQGRLWETEHGPQGGDELNLLQEGGNYGWPFVTYGMVYGSPPTEWPFSPAPGSTDTFIRPRYAFVPSIGISNLIAPDLREFPKWTDTLVVGSLRAMTLYVIRLDGDEVVYAEPIPLEKRLRDIAMLHDGRLAVLTDGGGLIMIQNLEKHPDPKPVTVTGLKALPRPSIEEAPPPSTTNRYQSGRARFMSACASCHSPTGEPSAGPSLQGVFGRPVASLEGYPYSSALKNLGGNWTEDRLVEYINHPNAMAPGTAMPFAGLFDWEVPSLITFLQSQ